MAGPHPPQGPGSPGSSGQEGQNYGIKLPASLPAYRPQFTINLKAWREHWQKLFKDQQLTDKEVHQMTDQFVNFVWNQMNHVLQHALQNMKDLEKQREDSENQ